MTRIVFTQAGGLQAVVQAKNGASLMLAALESNVPGILGECGGSVACGTCHVYIEEGRLADLCAMSEAESEMLAFTASERRDNSRLACQVEISEAMDGIGVEIPETQI